MKDFLWTEIYRPKTVAECILPDRLKSVFQSYVDKREIPNLLLTGTACVGKTTIAIAMCEEIGINYMFIKSSEESGIDTIRNKITNYASTVSLMGDRKVIILDEADGLSHEAQKALRGAIEAFSKNCTFILTCNYKAKIIEAIHSRSAVIDFTLRSEEKPKMASLFYKRLCAILKEQNVEYKQDVLVKIVEKYFPDFRRIVNELQRYSSTGKIDETTLAQINAIKNISDLVALLKDKNWSGMRKWVTLNSDTDQATINRKIYNGMSEFLKPESIPQCVVIIGRYQYQAAFVSDLEINMVAMLTEIMVECEFLLDI